LPIVSLVIALIVSYYFGTQFGTLAHIPDIGGVSGAVIGGIYGTTLATMGMLAVMGMVLALDGFGPIADNAAGIAEMSGEGGAEETMEALDAVGNTTKALTKGFALGSALLAAQLLFQTYASEVFGRTGVKFCRRYFKSSCTNRRIHRCNVAVLLLFTSNQRCGKGCS